VLEVGVDFGEGGLVPFPALRRIQKDPDSVFRVIGGAVEKVMLFSPETQKTYKLRPTRSWPALEISGVLMHRVAGTDPLEDAASKVRALGRGRLGEVLDTCCGLGYTAILGAKRADAVTTIEIDPSVISLARLNPHSRPLFVEGSRIQLRSPDACTRR
jgi:predicted methyltransferase